MFTILFVLVTSALIVLASHLVYWVIKAVCSLAHWHNVSYHTFRYVLLGLLVGWLLVMCYGCFVGRFRYQVRTLTVSHPQLPVSFHGYRIVHISDLHLDGWAGHESQLQQVIDTIHGLHPDLICFTGDLVSLSPAEITPFTHLLHGLQAPDGVISVMGNHDYLPYRRKGDRDRQQCVQQVIHSQRDELGWNLLLNQHTYIHRGADSIAIIGCENQSVGAHPVVQRGRLSEAVAGTEGHFRILLTHDPSHWRAEVVPDTDIPLTLSGHTHAMQFRIGGFTPSHWIYPECDGLYQQGQQQLYVNIGLGGTLPMRIGATPEITLIELKCSQ